MKPFACSLRTACFPHSLDRDILDRLQRLGCRHLNLPLVSSSASTLKKLNRPGDTLSFSRIVSEAGDRDAGASETRVSEAEGRDAGTSEARVTEAGASEAGVSEAGTSEAGTSAAETIGAGTREARASAAGNNFFITGYLILGLPDSDLEEMVESIRFLAGQRVLIAPSIFYATPGMELYAEGMKSGWLPVAGGLSALRSSAFPIETDRFSRLDLVTLFRLIRAVNFIKSLIDEIGEGGDVEMRDGETGRRGDGETGGGETGRRGRRGNQEDASGGESGGGGLVESEGLRNSYIKREMKLSEFLKALIAEFRSTASANPLAELRSTASANPHGPEAHPLSPDEATISSSRPLSQRELGLWLLSQWLGAGLPAFHRIQRKRQVQQGPNRGQKQEPGHVDLPDGPAA